MCWQVETDHRNCGCDHCEGLNTTEKGQAVSCQNYRARDLGRCGRYQGISHHTAVSDPGVTELGNIYSQRNWEKQTKYNGKVK